MHMKKIQLFYGNNIIFAILDITQRTHKLIHQTAKNSLQWMMIIRMMPIKEINELQSQFTWQLIDKMNNLNYPNQMIQLNKKCIEKMFENQIRFQAMCPSCTAKLHMNKMYCLMDFEMILFHMTKDIWILNRWRCTH